MKKILILLMGLGLILTAPLVSYAALFSDTVDFYGSGTDSGRTYLELKGNTTNFVYRYSQDVTFFPPAAQINSAEIILSHRKNSDTPGEVWLIYAGTYTRLGQLNWSQNSWLDQSFTLPGFLYSVISGGSWSLEVKLTEITTGTDKIWLDRSVLSGEYLPVPIPSAMLLLGSGLIGLVGVGRKGRR